MPDQNPTDPQNPVTPTATDTPPVPEPVDMPAMDGSEVSPPPPIVVQEEAGSAAPPPGLPEEMPKKKFGRGRLVATILGILILVGGLGAGLVLVQQQQLFKQKASLGGPCKQCNESTRKCQTVAAPPNCSISENKCSSDTQCAAPTFTPTAVRPPTPPTGTASGTPTLPTGTPACIATGSCKTASASCCSGSGTSDSSCSTGIRCVGTPTPTLTTTPACIATGSCKTASASCCSGSGTSDSSCSLGIRCVGTPTPTPSLRGCSQAGGCGSGGCPSTQVCILDGIYGLMCKNSASCTTPTPSCTPVNTCLPSSGTGGVCCSGLVEQSYTACSTSHRRCVTPSVTLTQTPTTTAYCKDPVQGCKCSGNCTWKKACGVDFCDCNGDLSCDGSGSGGGDPCKDSSGKSVSCSTLGRSRCNCGNGIWVGIYGSNCTAACACISCPTCTTPPPPDVTTCRCLAVRAWDTNWVELKGDQLSALKAGDRVRFTVSATFNKGGVDKAKFKVNGQETGEITTLKPGETAMYYYEYVMPEGVSAFSISAKIHHTTLGWSQ